MAAAAEEALIDQLTQAAANANTDRLRALLEQHPELDVNQTNQFGRTAIQVMSTMCPTTARLLLERGANPNLPDPDVGRTPLHDVAETGCVETLNLLLHHGADPAARDNWGNTPAHLAAMKGGSSRVEILERLSHISNLREQNNAGQTPLAIATQRGHRDVEQWLQNYQSCPQSLEFLARRAIRARISPRQVRALQERNLIPAGLVAYLEDR